MPGIAGWDTDISCTFLKSSCLASTGSHDRCRRLGGSPPHVPVEGELAFHFSRWKNATRGENNALGSTCAICRCRVKEKSRALSRNLVVLVVSGFLVLCSDMGFAARKRQEELDLLAGKVVSAMKSKDFAALKQLMDEEGIDADDRFGTGPDQEVRHTLLSLAMVLRRLPIAEFLLDQGASVDLESKLLKVGKKGASETGTIEAAYTPLMFAAQAGFVEGAKLLLEKGAGVDTASADGCTALIVAAAFNRGDVGRLLLGAKADPELSLKGTKCLSAFPGPYLGFKGYLPRPVAELPPGSGATALWIAAAVGADEMVKILVEAGADRSEAASCADVPAADPREKECTPERIAGLLGRNGAAKLLGDVGKDPTATIDVQRSDLATMSPDSLMQRLTAIMQRQDAAALEAYLDAGLRVNDIIRTKEIDFVPITTGTPLIMACAASAPQLVKLLLDHGADPNVYVERTRNNALLAAIDSNCAACVGLLLDAEAHLGGIDGVPPLIRAAGSPNNPGIVQRLLDAGADPSAAVRSTMKSNTGLADGATALWVAAYYGRTDIASVLLQAGADLNAAAYCGSHPRASVGEKKCTVRRIAELQQQQYIIDLIDGNETIGGKPSIGSTAPRAAALEEILAQRLTPEERDRAIGKIIRDGDIVTLRALIEGGLDVDKMLWVGAGYATPLAVAINSKNIQIVELLLAHGADVDQMSRHDPGLTGPSTYQLLSASRVRYPGEKPPQVFVAASSPLVDAVHSRSGESLDRLLKAGANVRAAGANGLTALMAAARAGDSVMVSKLIAAGASREERIDNRERDPRMPPHRATALWLAVFSGKEKTVRVLLDAGADADCEAECRSRYVKPTERLECSPRRFAELEGNVALVRAIDEHLRRNAVTNP